MLPPSILIGFGKRKVINNNPTIGIRKVVCPQENTCYLEKRVSKMTETEGNMNSFNNQVGGGPPEFHQLIPFSSAIAHNKSSLPHHHHRKQRLKQTGGARRASTKLASGKRRGRPPAKTVNLADLEASQGEVGISAISPPFPKTRGAKKRRASGRQKRKKQIKKKGTANRKGRKSSKTSGSRKKRRCAPPTRPKRRRCIKSCKKKPKTRRKKRRGKKQKN